MTATTAAASSPPPPPPPASSWGGTWPGPRSCRRTQSWGGRRQVAYYELIFNLSILHDSKIDKLFLKVCKRAFCGKSIKVAIFSWTSKV